MMQKLKETFFPKSKDSILKSIENLLKEQAIKNEKFIIVESDFEKCVDGIEDKEIKKSFEDSYFEDLYLIKSELKNIDLNLNTQCSNLVNTLKKGEELKYVEKLKSSLGKKREQMPQIDAKLIGDFILHFSDKVDVKKVKKSLSSLKPTQGEINEDKVYDFISKYFSNKKEKLKDDNRYIISKDNYLLDGHHRWAADLEINDSQKVYCYKIDLPINELLNRSKRLNLTTKKDINDSVISKSIEIPEQKFIDNNLMIKESFDKGLITQEILDKVIESNKFKIRISKIEEGVENFFWVNKK